MPRPWARTFRCEVVALWIAAHDGRTPPLARLVGAAVAAYALSLIDLIPDVIPVLARIDDLLRMPLAVLTAVRLIPPALTDTFRAAAPAQPIANSSRACPFVTASLSQRGMRPRPVQMSVGSSGWR